MSAENKSNESLEKEPTPEKKQETIAGCNLHFQVGAERRIPVIDATGKPIGFLELRSQLTQEILEEIKILMREKQMGKVKVSLCCGHCKTSRLLTIFIVDPGELEEEFLKAMAEKIATNSLAIALTKHRIVMIAS